MRAYLAACDRAEREQRAAEFSLLVTAIRGGEAEIKSLAKRLGP
jgi:hypothetical protein